MEALVPTARRTRPLLREDWGRSFVVVVDEAVRSIDGLDVSEPGVVGVGGSSAGLFGLVDILLRPTPTFEKPMVRSLRAPMDAVMEPEMGSRAPGSCWYT